jgi:SAM-dependent methyltransferase
MSTEPGLIPPPPPAIDYAARWADLVERRRAQMDAAFAAAGQSSGDYWARRAKSYREALHARTEEDPFYLAARRVTTASSTVLDVGAGTGRHTLALAPHVRGITAIDPSPAMLGLLREDLAALRLGNVTTIESEWMSAATEPADVVLCSHVLYPIADVVPFLRKLHEAARERVLIYLRADPLSTDMDLWREFYGVPLQHQPVHMDLLNVLAQIDIFADVEIVEHRFTLTYQSIEDAVSQLRYGLCLREGDTAAEEKLRRLLSERLVRWPDGRLGPPVSSARTAILSWAPPA